MKRWLVIFSSHPEPPSDSTVVEVRASTQIQAIAIAKRTTPPAHPWSSVSAIPWPKGCPSVDEAAALLDAAGDVSKRKRRVGPRAARFSLG